MATRVSEPIRWLAEEWEDNCGYASAVLSGIAPDEAHKRRGGYHCSIQDLIANGNGNDYSNTRPDDKGFNPLDGAAIDMSMGPADMKLCYTRLRRVWDDRTDPRRKYLNAVNCYKGTGDATRLDYYANTAGTASADHKWHNHAECRRRYLQDWVAVRAIASALKGETKEQYMAATAFTVADQQQITTTNWRTWWFLDRKEVGDNHVNNKFEKYPMVMALNRAFGQLDQLAGGTGLTAEQLAALTEAVTAGVLAGLQPQLRTIVREELDNTGLAKRS